MSATVGAGERRRGTVALAASPTLVVASWRAEVAEDRGAIPCAREVTRTLIDATLWSGSSERFLGEYDAELCNLLAQSLAGFLLCLAIGRELLAMCFQLVGPLGLYTGEVFPQTRHLTEHRGFQIGENLCLLLYTSVHNASAVGEQLFAALKNFQDTCRAGQLRALHVIQFLFELDQSTCLMGRVCTHFLGSQLFVFSQQLPTLFGYKCVCHDKTIVFGL
mmetsp:Transcript_27289/g.68497  ORF Transcript_27289/g.68497 Transcript_27289/m.68497 type:complete len:220 (+) Transcript_27289:1056-1715(+)